MRLLLASYYYPPSIGGVEQQSHLLARGLIQRGHCVRVISARLDAFARTEVLDGVIIERVSPGRGSRWQKMATYVAGLLAATIRMRQWADIIQVQQVLYPAAAISLIAPLLRRPLVVRNAGSGEFGGVQLMRHMPLGLLSLGLIGRGAAGVSLNAEMTLEMREAGFRQVVEIPNGVELLPERSAYERGAARQLLGLDGPMVLYVGRLEPEKGVDLLVRAWRKVESADAKLLIVGDGPERETLQGLAAEEPRGRAIEFVGTSSNVRQYFHAADLFVLPSRSEGISNSLLEAMAVGIPVVATDVGGNRQVIDSPDVGTLVSPQSPAALAEAVRGILARPELSRTLGASARAHVAARYSADVMVDSYVQLYRSLICARRRWTSIHD